MAHLFASIVFTVAALSAVAYVAVMLWHDWERVGSILGGRGAARGQVQPVRVRLRAWPRTEARGFAPARRAVAA